MLVLFPEGITHLPFCSTLGTYIVVEITKKKVEKNKKCFIPHSETVIFCKAYDEFVKITYFRPNTGTRYSCDSSAGDQFPKCINRISGRGGGLFLSTPRVFLKYLPNGLS